MFEDLIIGWREIRDGLKAKDYKASFHGVRVVVDAVDDMLNGPPMVGATESQQEELKALVAECCAEAGCEPPAMEALGDGKLLEKLQQLALQLVPLLIKFLPYLI